MAHSYRRQVVTRYKDRPLNKYNCATWVWVPPEEMIYPSSKIPSKTWWQRSLFCVGGQTRWVSYSKSLGDSFLNSLTVLFLMACLSIFLLLGFPVVSASDTGGPIHNDGHYVRTWTAGKYSCSCLRGSNFYAFGRLRLRLWLSYSLPSSTQLQEDYMPGNR